MWQIGTATIGSNGGTEKYLGACSRAWETMRVEVFAPRAIAQVSDGIDALRFAGLMSSAWLLKLGWVIASAHG